MPEYNINITVSGKDKASPALKGVGGALSSMGKIAGGIIGAQIFTKIANGILNLGKKAISSTANLQAMQVGLEGLLAREIALAGGFDTISAALPEAQKHAKGLMDELARIAIVSPYQIETINNTFKTAMAFGWASDEAKSFTKSVLNVASGVGASNEQMGRMSYNLAQIKLQGRVTAMDIRQLAMAGFDLTGVLKYVGDQMGVQIDDHNDFNRALERGKITWQDFITNFEKYADDNFGGAAERMSRTLVGLGSTIKDVFALTFPAILGPAAEIFTEFAGGMLDNFFLLRDSGVLEQIGENFGTAVGDWLVPFQEFSGRVGEMFGLMFAEGVIEDGMDISLKKMDFASAFQEVFSIDLGSIPLLDQLSGVFDRIKAAIGDVFTEIKGFVEENGDTFTEIASSLLEIGTAIWDFAYPALLTLWQDVLEPLAAGVLENLALWLETIAQLLEGDFAGAWATVGGIMTAWFGTLKELFSNLINWLSETFLGEGIAVITGRFVTYWAGAVNSVKAWWTGLKATFSALLEKIITSFNTFILKMKLRFVRFKLALQKIILKIKDDFKEKMHAMTVVVDIVFDSVAKFLGILKNLWKWLKEHIFAMNFIGGGGALADIMPTGPGRQRQFGGTMFSGRNYLIGENGPEILRLPYGQSGQIVSGYDMHASGGSRGGNTFNVTINARDVDIDENKLIDLLQNVEFQYA